ncbi:hypothetical protein CDIK_4037 [Cucumispora dikerogammari]|nr:hypothetical protein CDIK_4037 [Cucumispora dikerogammari]
MFENLSFLFVNRCFSKKSHVGFSLQLINYIKLSKCFRRRINRRKDNKICRWKWRICRSFICREICTYKLNFRHEETKCILYVDLNIKKNPTNIHLINFYAQLVKCNGNIEMNRLDNDYEIKFDQDKDKYSL